MDVAAAAACEVPLGYVVRADDDPTIAEDDEAAIESFDDEAARCHAAHGLSTTIPIRFYASAPIVATGELASRIATIQKSTPAMLHSIDPQVSCSTVSGTWLSELGYARDEAIGRTIFDFYTPASRDELVCGDGSVLVALLSSLIQRDDAGTPLCTLTVYQNMTLRRQTGASLREEQERMARILERTISA